jgi:hypothetical protein
MTFGSRSTALAGAAAIELVLDALRKKPTEGGA